MRFIFFYVLVVCCFSIYWISKIQRKINSDHKMPVKCEVIPPPSQSKQLGFPKTLLYNGSKFEGSQKSKGNSYAVEVVLQVCSLKKKKIFLSVYRDFTYERVPMCTCAWFDNDNNMFVLLLVFVACWWREFIFVWLFEDYRAHIRISHAHHILWWRNYFEKIPIFDTKMGRRWRCRQKTLEQILCIQE